jgi:hypothetical protein
VKDFDESVEDLGWVVKTFLFFFVERKKKRVSLHPELED